MKAENRKQLVRGVVAVGNRYSGVVTDNPIEAEKHDTIIAYTHWYRHDDDLDQLERDLNMLVRCYSRMSKTSGMSVSYQYKDYKS